jgi:hypothetical protein
LSWIALGNAAVCQPDAVSFVKVTAASFAPVGDQRVPVCVPVVVVSLKNFSALTVPSTRGVKRVPSSTLDVSDAAAEPVGVELFHIVT